MSDLPDGLIAYGSDANCTLDICPVEWSVVGYQPSLAASGAFIALFAITMILHTVQGVFWRTWSFTACIVAGCLDEIIGYAGRIILNSNPFSFNGFLMEIICLTTAPVFFCAAIYVTLARTIAYLDPSVSRFDPRFFYWFFIPCDIISLALQAGGGATSSTSTGSDSAGVNISLAGLSFQVFTLVVFIAAAADYMIRYVRSPGRRTLETRFKVFLGFLSFATILILIRCIYRIDELSEGYNGPLFHEEGLFYGLEGVMVVVATFCLHLGHPGLGFRRDAPEQKEKQTSGTPSVEA